MSGLAWNTTSSRAMAASWPRARQASPTAAFTRSASPPVFARTREDRTRSVMRRTSRPFMGVSCCCAHLSATARRMAASPVAAATSTTCSASRWRSRSRHACSRAMVVEGDSMRADCTKSLPSGLLMRTLLVRVGRSGLSGDPRRLAELTRRGRWSRLPAELCVVSVSDSSLSDASEPPPPRISGMLLLLLDRCSARSGPCSSSPWPRSRCSSW